MKWGSKSLLYKYTIFYFVVFFVPFSALSLIFYHSSIQNVQQQFETNMANEVEQIQRQVEEQLSSLRSLGNWIHVEPSLSPAMVADAVAQPQGMSILSGYIAAHSSLGEIGIYYFAGADRVFTSRGIFDLDVFHRTFFFGTEMGIEELEAYMASSLPFLASYVRDGRYVLQYFFPLYGAFRSHQGVAIFLLDTESLGRILPTYSHPFFIVDEANRVVFSNRIGEQFIDEEGRLTIDLSVASDRISEGDNTYWLAREESSDLGLTFLTLVNREELAPFLLESRLFIFTQVGLLILLGILVVLMAAYRQYKPIKDIYRHHLPTGGGDELEGIGRMLSGLALENENLNTEVLGLKRMEEIQSILELLEGREGFVMPPFLQCLQEKGKLFTVAVMERVEQAKLQVTPLQTADFEAHMFQVPLQKQFGILVIHFGDNYYDDLKALSEYLHTKRLNHGHSYSELNQVNHSYIEALIACDYLVDEKTQLVAYEAEEPLHSAFLEYPKDLETKLLHSIRQGAQAMAMLNLKEIFLFLKQNRQYGEETRLYSYYIIKILVVTAAELGMDRNLSNLKGIMKFQDFEELEESLVALTDCMIASVHQERNIAQQGAWEQIAATIMAEFKSPDFNLEYLAEKYDYSVSYMSKIIKERFGMTFSKHIQNLRMEYIKKELRETDLPIKDIIQLSGYYDVSNFIRTFKKKEGITPGQYRQMNIKD